MTYSVKIVSSCSEVKSNIAQIGRNDSKKLTSSETETVAIILIAPDYFQPKSTNIFSYFSKETYVVGTH